MKRNLDFVVVFHTEVEVPEGTDPQDLFLDIPTLDDIQVLRLKEVGHLPVNFLSMETIDVSMSDPSDQLDSTPIQPQEPPDQESIPGPNPQ